MANERSVSPWIFPLIVGVLIGLTIGYWGTISGLWNNRKTIGGASKVSEGLQELGIGS